MQTIEVHALVGATGPTCAVGSAAGLDHVRVQTASAIGLVANFEYRDSQEERDLDEFNWASQFNKELFGRLEDAGLPMENTVYYQGDTLLRLHPQTGGARCSGSFALGSQ